MSSGCMFISCVLLWFRLRIGMFCCVVSVKLFSCRWLVSCSCDVGWFCMKCRFSMLFSRFFGIVMGSVVGGM